MVLRWYGIVNRGQESKYKLERPVSPRKERGVFDILSHLSRSDKEAVLSSPDRNLQLLSPSHVNTSHNTLNMSISHPSSTSRTLTPPSTSTYALPKQSTPASSSTLHDIDLEKKTSTEMNGDDDSDEISPYSEKTTSLTADEMRSRAQSQAQAKAIAGGRERDPSPSSSTLHVTTDSPEQSPTTTTTTPKHGEKSWQTSDKDLVKQPENNLLLVMPSLMLCLFLAALDQTIVGEWEKN